MRTKIFVINLKTSLARRKIMEKQLEKLGLPFEIFDAVKGSELSEEEILSYYCEEYYNARPKWFTPGAAGCTLSHYFLYKKIVEEKIEVALILEDDMELGKDLPAVIDKIGQQLRDDEVIMLFYQSYQPINLSGPTAQPISEKYSLYQVADLNRLRSTGAYMINYEGAKRMTERLLPFSSFPDDWESFYDRKILNGVRVLYPFILENTYEPTTISPNKKGGQFFNTLVRFVEARKIFPFYQLLKWRRKTNIIKSRRCFIINESPTDYRNQ